MKGESSLLEAGGGRNTHLGWLWHQWNLQPQWGVLQVSTDTTQSGVDLTV